MNLVLSLFPGIGLLDLAFETEGFCAIARAVRQALGLPIIAPALLPAVGDA